MGMEDQSLPPGMMNTMRDERGIMDFMGTKTPYESHGDPLSLPVRLLRRRRSLCARHTGRRSFSLLRRCQTSAS